MSSRKPLASSAGITVCTTIPVLQFGQRTRALNCDRRNCSLNDTAGSPRQTAARGRTPHSRPSPHSPSLTRRCYLLIATTDGLQYDEFGSKPCLLKRSGEASTAPPSSLPVEDKTSAQRLEKAGYQTKWLYRHDAAAQKLDESGPKSHGFSAQQKT